jgi:SAM-dependent methyltransferase
VKVAGVSQVATANRGRPASIEPTAASVISPTGQSGLDTRNAEFWNTLCGTGLARQMGITDHSQESIRKFDERYFGSYPYLLQHIPFGAMNGRRVLEVGLGYGTVAQRLAESGADYTGLDIADGPVAMANYRLRLHGLAGEARRGSILSAPFDDSSFDIIVAIGCFHHTGDLQRAFDESHRLLRAGGLLAVMVYNAYSYRRWVNSVVPTFRYLLWDRLKIGRPPLATPIERGAYDQDPEGSVAPHTDFVSRHHLRGLCRNFREFRACLENIDQERPFQNRPRTELLKTKWPSVCGLDIYLRALR